MDASPNMDSITAHSDGDVVHWLTNDVMSASVIVFSLSCVPEIMFADDEAEFAGVDQDVGEGTEYINSPANEIH